MAGLISIHECEPELKSQVEGTFNSHAKLQDENGVYTVVEYRLPDGRMFLRSTAENPDANGNYQTITWQYYDEKGTNVYQTKTWTIRYDADGNIAEKAVE